MTNENGRKDIPPINSVTDHYQNIVGSPKRIYCSENISKWLIALLIGVAIIIIAIVTYYFLFVANEFTYSIKPAPEVERLVIEKDQDGDGVFDLDDIIQEARKEVDNQPRYKSAYYSGGYPPDEEGVCTDVIWLM